MRQTWSWRFGLVALAGWWGACGAGEGPVLEPWGDPSDTQTSQGEILASGTGDDEAPTDRYVDGVRSEGEASAFDDGLTDDEGAAPSGDDGIGLSGDEPDPGAVARHLRVEGRYLLDRCGQPFVVRGVEQIFGYGLDVGGSWTALVDEIAKSGANAVRVLPDVVNLTLKDLDSIFARIVEHGMVFFVSPGDRSWFERADVKELLSKYEGSLIVDALQERDYDDPTRWKADAIASISQVREAGYTVPVTVLANLSGRDLPSLLMEGPDLIAADPEANTILGWQAYWGKNHYYQDVYGLELDEAFATIAAQDFVVQAGIDGYADPGDQMDYEGAMDAAALDGIGWLWWDWYNPFGDDPNKLSLDGTAANLSAFGEAVVLDSPNGLKTARKACRP